MAKIVKVKPENKTDHRLAISGDRDGEVFLVKGGKLAYLWAGPRQSDPENFYCVTISGPKVLRRLAEEILKEIGPN